MKKKNGFIATSLIYSFFLVFIAIIMALINSYVANKTILTRFNETVMDNINGNKYTITVYSKNAAIKEGGRTLNNLITNGSFIDTNGWSYRNYYYYQNVPLTANHIYYYSISYAQNHNTQLQTYVTNQTYTTNNGKTIYTNNTRGEYQNDYGWFKASSNSTQEFRLGYSTSNHGTTNFTNIMLIDLTRSYGNNNEPNIEWLFNNLEWFDETTNFVKKEWESTGNDIEINMAPYNKDSTITKLECKYDNNTAIASDSITQNESKLTIKNLTNNMTCKIEWS